jgi:hypothetical protein
MKLSYCVSILARSFVVISMRALGVVGDVLCFSELD